MILVCRGAVVSYFMTPMAILCYINFLKFTLKRNILKEHNFSEKPAIAMPWQREYIIESHGLNSNL